MYVSHPVRRICERPDREASVSLAVGRGDVDAEAFAERIAALDGEILDEGRFSTVVRLPETAVADLCATPGLERVETAETLGLGIEKEADAGDDESTE